jgi:thymidylate synthase (FAD)
MDFQVRDDVTVELVQHAGNDEMICKAARVSTLGADSIASEESAGLIRFLMRNRHGSPFEHGFMTFRIHAPIFVWREYMRHRIGFSYNEESGRYKELEGVVYIPGRGRPLVQTGKPGEYKLSHGTDIQYDYMLECQLDAHKAAWRAYRAQLDAGIAKEVARMILPVSTYSTAYVSLNPRSMMSFLSLRVESEQSLFPSKPMFEINRVADLMEATFRELYQITADAFVEAQRVAP